MVYRLRFPAPSQVLVAGFVLALCVFDPSAAHEPAAARIEVLDEHLHDHPDPEGLLERAELHRVSGNWDAAERDCDRAIELDPELHLVLLSRARISLDRGDPEVAVDRTMDFLARIETSDGYRVLARAQAAAGKPAESAIAYRQAIALAERPDPDLYFEWARQEVAADRVDAALAALDDGCARLGPLRALRVLAIRIAHDAERLDTALDHVDALLAEGGRTESWHAERGRILTEAGRVPEAWAAFSDALVAIERLPAHHRSTPAIRRLQSEIEERLRTFPERTQR